MAKKPPIIAIDYSFMLRLDDIMERRGSFTLMFDAGTHPQLMRNAGIGYINSYCQPVYSCKMVRMAFTTKPLKQNEHAK